MKQIEQAFIENPLGFKHGIELGQRGRDGRKYSIFWKEMSKAKSGKAVKGLLTISFSNLDGTNFNSDIFGKDGFKFHHVQGITYLPNFAIEGQALDWIIENKLALGHSRRQTGEYHIEAGFGVSNEEQFDESFDIRTDETLQQHAESLLQLLRDTERELKAYEEEKAKAQAQA